MIKHSYIFLAYLLSLPCSMQAQLFSTYASTFSHADSLRGTLNIQRSCYDVTFYDLDVDVDINKESISGSNSIYFKAASNFKTLQVDLESNMVIDSVMSGINKCTYLRDGHAVIISMPHEVLADEKHSVVIFYHGTPRTGKRLPWDGGFKWTKDENSQPWVVVACQGEGASLWWPCKDHQSDEPDSMSIKVTVPAALMDVSNGRLRAVTPVNGGKTQYHWFVSYPINSYNVTLNIGVFAHFNDVYASGSDTLTLDYYVKPTNLSKAKKQFEQVKPMLSCFEKYFGKYPFYRDGYKLVESPYLGMEHQSCIAYGNDYKTAYAGLDYSQIGLKFDYIIIHETAHEWWGNNITTKDIADMWVHEGFGSYAEVLYVECVHGKEIAQAYVNSQKKKISNDRPVIGPYGVNKEGSGDMYPKGSVLLNTLRSCVNNDSLWFEIVFGLQRDFALQTVTTADIEKYISSKAGINFSSIFDQYLRTTDVPLFAYSLDKEKKTINYRWQNVVTGFNMPIEVTVNKKQVRLLPTAEWQTFPFEKSSSNTIKVRDDLFYVDVKQVAD